MSGGGFVVAGGGSVGGGSVAGGSVGGGSVGGGSVGGGSVGGGSVGGGSVGGGSVGGGSVGGGSVAGGSVAGGTTGDAGTRDGGTSDGGSDGGGGLDGGLFDPPVVIPPCLSDGGRVFGTGLTARDLDGDGVDDLIVSDGSRPLCVYFGRRDATFDPVALPRSTTAGVSFVHGRSAAVDLNEDGRLDLVVGNTNLSSGAVTTYVALGGRQFARTDWPPLSTGPLGLVDQLAVIEPRDGGLMGLMTESSGRVVVGRVLPDAGIVLHATVQVPLTTTGRLLGVDWGETSLMTVDTEHTSGLLGGSIRFWARNGGGFFETSRTVITTPYALSPTARGPLFTTHDNGLSLGFLVDGGLSKLPITWDVGRFVPPLATTLGSSEALVLLGDTRVSLIGHLQVYAPVADGGWSRTFEHRGLPSGSNAVAAGDFDADGRQDLAVLTNAFGTVGQPALHVFYGR